MPIENKKSFDKYKGLKITAIGFAVALFGFLLFALEFYGAGRVILFFGFAIGFIGMLIHMKAFYSTVIKKDD